MHLSDLHTFAAVAVSGSYTAAARELGVPKSTISRRVARLQEQLGVALFLRSANGLELTQDGEQFFRSVTGPLADIEAAEERMRGIASAPSGALVINAPHDVGATRWFSSKLARYTRLHPDVRVEVRLTDAPLDMVREGVDVALRPRGEEHDPRLISRRCARLVGGVYAAPELAAELCDITSLDELSGARAVSHTGMKRPREWELCRAAGGVHLLAVDPVFLANDFNLAAAAVCDGVGVGLLPELIGDALVERGELVRLFAEWSFVRGELWLLWPESRHMSPRVRALVDLFVDDPS